MTKTRGAGTRDPKGIREELRRMVREEVNGRSYRKGRKRTFL